MKSPGIVVSLWLLAGTALWSQVDQPARPVAQNLGGISAPEYPRYAIIDLGVGVTPIRVRNNGWVLIEDSNGNYYRWINGTLQSLTSSDTSVSVFATDMNNQGVVVGGYSTDDTSINADGGGGMQWAANSAVGTKTEAPVTGAPNPNTPLNGTSTLKLASFSNVTDSGNIYGASYSGCRIDYAFNSNPSPFSNIYEWPNLSGSFVPLSNCIALGTNSNTLVWWGWANPLPRISGASSAHYIGTIETPGSPQYSGYSPWDYIPDNPVGGSGMIDGAAVDFIPAAVNNGGVVVGNNNTGMVLWTGPSAEIIIGHGGPVAINDASRQTGNSGATVPAPQILGYVGYLPAVPTLWELTSDLSHYVPETLADMVSITSGWAFTSVIDINDQGAIVGYGTYQGQGHGFLLLPAELGVDANRDGTIVLVNEQSSPANVNSNGQQLPIDITSAVRPFCFWWNNGIDGYEDVGDFPVSNATVSVQGDLNPSDALNPSNDVLLNYQLSTITCTRDLENLARLWLYTKGATMFGSGSVVVGLEWDSNSGDAVNGWGASDGAPAINLYAAAPKHGATINTGGSDYLSDPATATDQIASNYVNALGTVSKGHPFYFSPMTFANVNDANPKSYFLFEGTNPGKGRLVITYNILNPGTNTYTKIGVGGQVFMDIEDIKMFYERWTVGNGPNPNPHASFLFPYSGGGLPASQATISNARLPSGVATGFTYGPSNPGLSLSNDPQANQYILFVHGYNMQPWEKDSFAATMLKRLYWQGYKGKFGAYQWPDAYHTVAIGGLFDYDMSEYSAWWSGFPFKYLVQQLAGQYANIYALGHSQGNIVIGEALRLVPTNSQPLLTGYVASQAALPVQCYDPSQPTPIGFFTGQGQSRITPNVYPNWMGTSGPASAIFSNFFNTNDWALSNGIWQTDERVKPDYYSGLNPPYGFTGNINAVPIVNGFTNSLGPLNLANGGTNNDQYEIMAFAAQAQCLALGTVATNAQNIVSTDLTTLWGPDPFGNNFQDHVWHSAEFEFSNADQQNYWYTFLSAFHLARLNFINP